MEGETIIRRMAKCLVERENRWQTFRALSTAIGIPGIEAELIGAIADYRFDLFIVARARRIKLRTNIVQDIARSGIEKWKIPVRPEPPSQTAKDDSAPSSTRPLTGCYCGLPFSQILEDVIRGSIPDDALLRSCCWQIVCRVRGLHFKKVSPEVWQEICIRRGYLKSRENRF